MRILKGYVAISVISLLSILFLSSCGDIQTEIFINPDDSGKMEVSIDLGEMMSMMKGMGDMGMGGIGDDTISDDDVIEDKLLGEEVAPEDTIQYPPPPPKDPMEALMEKVTDPNYPLEFDTLISFMEIMPDSVKEKSPRQDLINKMAIHLKSPANSSDLTVGMVINYDNRQQFLDIINHLDTLSGPQNVMPGGMSGGFNKETFTLYETDLKAGWIKVDSTSYAGLTSEMGLGMGMPGDSTMGAEEMGMMEMLFGSSKIRSIIHVPGEVISCTNPDAIITKDDRVIIEYDFLDIIRKGKVSGYTIHFKPGK